MKLFCALITVFVVLITMAGPVWADEAEKININTASAQELQTLVRVGPKYAARIFFSSLMETTLPFSMVIRMVRCLVEFRISGSKIIH